MNEGPKMTCQEIEDLLSAHIDGELAPGEVAEVEGHLRVCRRCPATLEDLRSVVGAAGSVPSPKAPEGFKGRLMERIRADEASPPVRPAPAWLRTTVTGLAASFLILLVLHLGGLLGGTPRRAAAPVAARPATEKTPPEHAPPKDARRSKKGGGIEGEEELGLRAGREEEARALERKGPGKAVARDFVETEVALPQAAGEPQDPTAAEPREDLFREFAESLPPEQTLLIAVPGEEERREVHKTIARFQVAVPAGEAPAPPPAPDGDLKEAKGDESGVEEALGKGGKSGYVFKLSAEAEEGAEDVNLVTRREWYALFRLSLERIRGVEVRGGPEDERWARDKENLEPRYEELLRALLELRGEDVKAESEAAYAKAVETEKKAKDAGGGDAPARGGVDRRHAKRAREEADDVEAAEKQLEKSIRVRVRIAD
jgi:hypothetical protein